MGGARPVKNAQWYELSVAARLSSAPQKIDDAELDLTDFHFDPNRRAYPSRLTNAGYPAEIDITATKANTQYNVSCKFTERPERILKSRSKEFMEVILEFLPLLHQEETLGFRMNFILATNFMVSTEISLAGVWEFKQCAEFSRNIVSFGKKKFGDKFNADLFQPNQLKRLLNRLYMWTFGINELEQLHKGNRNFQIAFDVLCRRLLNVPKRGHSLHKIIQPDLIILCESPDHSECYDLVIEGRICHLGSLSTIQRRIEKALKTRLSHVVSKIYGMKVGLTPSDVKARRSMSPDGICRILNSILNNPKFFKIKYPYTFYVVPGAFEIVIFQPFALAEMIAETEDDLKRVQDIARLAYLHGFGYKLPFAEIVLDLNQL